MAQLTAATSPPTTTWTARIIPLRKEGGRGSGRGRNRRNLTTHGGFLLDSYKRDRLSTITCFLEGTLSRYTVPNVEFLYNVLDNPRLGSHSPESVVASHGDSALFWPSLDIDNFV